jgi:hypothetical protein
MFFLQVFNFRPPRIYNIDILDVVIEQHVLLLVSWEFKRKYCIHIKGIKKTYRSQHGSVVVKLPSTADNVQVTVRNFWRKRRFVTSLAKQKIDGPTAAALIQQLNPMLLPIVDNTIFSVITNPVSVSSGNIKLHHPLIKSAIPTTAYNHENFKYNVYE